MNKMKVVKISFLVATWLTVATLPNCGSFSGNSALDPCNMGCSQLGYECGTWLNECQVPLNCGNCNSGLTCRDDGICVENCERLTCEQLDKQCGSWSDGCNQDQDCGVCLTDQICNADGRCVDGALTQEDRVSECGGFEAAGGTLFDGPRNNYCDAEILHWQYEDTSQTLKLADARVLLNCCGEHSMTVEEQDGLFVFTETDAIGIGRCLCMCVYDFVIEVSGITSGTIPIRIERVVIDWPEGSGLVYEGELDLTQGSGSTVIDESNVYDWCY